MTLAYVARSGCIDRYPCLFVQSHEAMGNNARAIKQLCNARITLVLAANMQKSLYAQFDVNVAFTKYIMAIG